MGYYINTTNLQVSAFWIQNDSDSPVHLFITKFSDVIFVMNSSPYSGLTTQSISNFKFQRLPASDPDDPNSIRYPNGVNISMSSGYY